MNKEGIKASVLQRIKAYDLTYDSNQLRSLVYECAESIELLDEIKSQLKEVRKRDISTYWRYDEELRREVIVGQGNQYVIKVGDDLNYISQIQRHLEEFKYWDTGMIQKDPSGYKSYIDRLPIVLSSYDTNALNFIKKHLDSDSTKRPKEDNEIYKNIKLEIDRRLKIEKEKKESVEEKKQLKSKWENNIAGYKIYVKGLIDKYQNDREKLEGIKYEVSQKIHERIVNLGREYDEKKSKNDPHLSIYNEISQYAQEKIDKIKQVNISNFKGPFTEDTFEKFKDEFVANVENHINTSEDINELFDIASVLDKNLSYNDELKRHLENIDNRLAKLFKNQESTVDQTKLQKYIQQSVNRIMKAPVPIVEKVKMLSKLWNDMEKSGMILGAEIIKKKVEAIVGGEANNKVFIDALRQQLNQESDGQVLSMLPKSKLEMIKEISSAWTKLEKDFKAINPTDISAGDQRAKNTQEAKAAKDRIVELLKGESVESMTSILSKLDPSKDKDYKAHQLISAEIENKRQQSVTPASTPKGTKVAARLNQAAQPGLQASKEEEKKKGAGFLERLRIGKNK